ncbi:acyltransferase family protein [Ferrimonas marina]|uniref:Acyltransferase family protein n=1 Tax=Ferrimonas marina TaxID=299255 RepID=A0A1M5RFU4_9GAMM|nr:acyltransferase [Ferrimonas marina]SHH25000.1 Acyltransferase family protein [Ferrimonas marina]
MYLKDLHAFRGFAIVNIVLAHTGGVLLIVQYFMVGRTRTPGWENAFGLSETLFHGSTLYFALISGLLFSAVLAKKGWGRFVSSKLRYVLLPYLAMSLLFTLVFFDFEQGRVVVFPYASGTEFLHTLASHLMAGSASAQFWYLPTLAVLYLLTPLLWRLAQYSRVWLFALGLLPLLLPRTAIELSPQTVGYFLGAYSLGLALGMDYQAGLNWLRRWQAPLGAVALLTTLVLFMLVRKSEPLTSLGLLMESLFYLQKLALAALVLLLLNRYESRLPRALMMLGSYAFPIFFLHMFFIGPFTFALLTRFPPLLSGPINLLANLISLVVALTASVAVAWLLQRLLGRHSRSLIGA